MALYVLRAQPQQHTRSPGTTVLADCVAISNEYYAWWHSDVFGSPGAPTADAVLLHFCTSALRTSSAATLPLRSPAPRTRCERRCACRARESVASRLRHGIGHDPVADCGSSRGYHTGLRTAYMAPPPLPPPAFPPSSRSRQGGRARRIRRPHHRRSQGVRAFRGGSTCRRRLQYRRTRACIERSCVSRGGRRGRASRDSGSLASASCPGLKRTASRTEQVSARGPEALASSARQEPVRAPRSRQVRRPGGHRSSGSFQDARRRKVVFAGRPSRRPKVSLAFGRSKGGGHPRSVLGRLARRRRGHPQRAAGPRLGLGSKVRS